MRNEKKYCKERFDQSEMTMNIKRTPLNLETWPQIHRQMPGDAPKPLQNESSKKKKKAAKFIINMTETNLNLPEFKCSEF